MRLRPFAKPAALCAILMTCASTAACKQTPDVSQAETRPLPSYTGRGVVKSINEKDKTLLIAHQDIPGYMKAMTMAFPVQKAELLRGIAVGDQVSFTFTDDSKGNLFIQSIEKVP
jgi:Cu(I)/Ag(I) efflux system periplasmic protein CusF